MLAAFVEWGVAAAVERFVGMFAFAAWDAAERALWLGRDRFGEKPLHYAEVEGGLAFASELKALRRLPGFDASVDRGSLAGYLRGGYVVDDATIHPRAWKLPPGHLARLVPGGPVEPRSYWSPRTFAQSAAPE